MRKRNRLERCLATAKGQRYINYVYAIGAAIVIIGALFKVLHVSGGNIIFAIGMITEAGVFLISAFDPTMSGAGIDTEEENPAAKSGGVVVVGSGGTASGVSQQGGIAASAGLPAGVAQKQSVAGQTVIVGGGGGIVSAGSHPSPVQSGAQAGGAVSMEAAQQLNDVSSSLLDTYKKMADEAESVTTGNEGFAENVRLLNDNIKRLNHVFESQLSSVDGHTSISKYINESLENIRSMYDGAIADSYAFKRETEKMTRQIEALNRVYARLLQAMTTNNNPVTY